jgi:hypothetical protein
MAGRHRRRRKTITVFTLAILALIAAGFFLAQTVQAASLADFVWVNDAPAATNALPGQGA